MARGADTDDGLARRSAHAGRRVAAVVVAGMVLVLVAVALAPHRGRLLDDGGRRGPVPLYDTAWTAASAARLDELDEYFDHLQAAGFAGSMMWLTALSSVWPERVSAVTGEPTDRVDSAGRLRIDPEYVDALVAMLDGAQARGLSIVLAPAWEQDAVCGGHAKKPTVLTAANAYQYGVDIAKAVGWHPAVALWMFGGDAETGRDGKPCAADVEVWRNLAQGLRDNGALQRIGYHTAAGADEPVLQQRHVRWLDEPWVDVAFPQTGQCTSTASARAQLEAVVARARPLRKPVWSIEMRYESASGARPSFCKTDAKTTAGDIGADAAAAIDARVDVLAYGHHDRWQWGNRDLDRSVGAGGGFAAVRASFDAPGERAVLAARRAG